MQHLNQPSVSTFAAADLHARQKRHSLAMALGVPVLTAIVEVVAIAAFVSGSPRSTERSARRLAEPVANAVAFTESASSHTEPIPVETMPVEPMSIEVDVASDPSLRREGEMLPAPEKVFQEIVTPSQAETEALSDSLPLYSWSTERLLPPPESPEPKRTRDFWTDPVFTAKQLAAEALTLKEVGLEGMNRKDLLAFHAVARVSNMDDRDGFLKKLLRERPELAGLPFAMGNSCRRSAPEAAELAVQAITVRGILRPNQNNAEKFWDQYLASMTSSKGGSTRTTLIGSTRTLEQMLPTASADIRQNWVERLAQGKEMIAVRTIARRAVYDFDPSVRQAAVAALRSYPPSSYSSELVAAFRYPWAPVARHAAEAVVALDRVDLVTMLEAIAKAPSPYIVPGSNSTVREVVRIHHRRNCLLCHPTINRDAGLQAIQHKELPVGGTPAVDEESYYGGDMFVRADVTYLRQDFSAAILETGDRTEQRFDFVIRTRHLTPHEVKDLPETPRTLEQSPNGDALRFAIEQLTK